MAGAIEHLSGRHGHIIFRYGWVAPLAALLALAWMQPANYYHGHVWLFGCWLFTLRGMLSTPFHMERCPGCSMVVWLFSVAIALIVTRW